MVNIVADSNLILFSLLSLLSLFYFLYRNFVNEAVFFATEKHNPYLFFVEI